MEPIDQYKPPQANLGQTVASKAIELGGFIKTFMIMDIVFASLRILLALVSTVSYMYAPIPAKLKVTAPFEIGSNIALFVFGLTAAILILRRRPVGIMFAWITVVVTVGSIFVGLWQFSVLMPSGAQKTPYMVSGIVMVIIRIGLLGAYIAAVVLAAKKLTSSQMA